MNKFKEFLFLKQLRGMTNKKINELYLSSLKNINGINACKMLIKELEPNIKEKDLELAQKLAEEKFQEIMTDNEITVITVLDEKYPEKLHELKEKRPIIIYAKGNVEILKDNSIAVIGTRTPEEWSSKVETKLIQHILEKTQNTIISGLALGCDAIAHKIAAQLSGKTIAVLPAGVNQITPTSNTKLANFIIEAGGCLISEYEPNQKVAGNKKNYIERNALVAALSDAILVIECEERSGTISTVNVAEDLNRKILCFYPEESKLKEFEYKKFTGNKKILQYKNAIKLADKNDLEIFFEKKYAEETIGLKIEQNDLVEEIKNIVQKSFEISGNQILIEDYMVIDKAITQKNNNNNNNEMRLTMIFDSGKIIGIQKYNNSNKNEDLDINLDSNIDINNISEMMRINDRNYWKVSKYRRIDILLKLELGEKALNMLSAILEFKYLK